VARASKARIEAVASELMARDGYTGMGIKALSDSAQLPYGSIYHHFPGGKEEIAAAAISSTGAALGGLLEGLFAADGVTPGTIRTMFQFMADRLQRSGWEQGCSIGTPALDGSAGSALVRDACEAAFRDMARPIEEALVRQGRSPQTASQLATTLIATYEGATMLARAQRSVAPLEASGEAMVQLLATSDGG
jgi:TetR/AcrR family transcriptional repressor of lmrAB and yxaGH operons